MADPAFQLKKGDDVPDALVRMYVNDRDHSDQWRRDAKEDFDFAAGRQYTDEEIAALNKKKRPTVIFNRIGTVIDAITGYEIGNRRDVRYIPRELGDVKPNELLTGAGQWFNDTAYGDYAETALFTDVVICGMGWTESRIDYSSSPQGDPVIDHVDPFEMVWDKDARKRNLADAKRIYRTRRMPLTEAREMFPGFVDGELNATWSQVQSNSDLKREEDTPDPDATAKGGYVTVVHCQYITRETFYLAQDPLTGKEAEFTAAEFDTANKRLKKLLGMEMQGVRFRKKVWKQAFLGEVVLSYGDAPAQGEFSFQCVTGKYDRNKGTWYGVVRAMKDPQRWANKWLAQMMFIMNANSKGGLLVESSATDDMRELEKKWAEADSVIKLNDGAINGNRIKEKGQAPFPVGFQQLTEFAITSIRDVSGVSVELLGLRAADQPASLELQRRQAGMNILQWAFDGLKLYAEKNGRVILWYLQHDLSDGRLVRILGKENEQYVPLVKQASAEYDIIVDDSPTSPNQKEQVWQIISAMLPSLGKIIPPQFILKMLKYSPFPSSVVQELEEMANAPNPQAQEQAAMRARAAAATVAEIESKANLNNAKARETGRPEQQQIDNSGLEWRKALLDSATKLEVARINASTKSDADGLSAQIDMMLGMAGLEQAETQHIRQMANQRAIASMSANREREAA